MQPLTRHPRCGTRTASMRTTHRPARAHPALLGAVSALAGLSLTLAATACGSQHSPANSHAAATTSTSAPPPTPEKFTNEQLITGTNGWVLSDNALSLTSDDGQNWTDITPPGVPASAIRGVYFMDAQHGWAVSASTDNQAQLEISTTNDAGSSWSTSPLGNPQPVFTDSASLPAYIDFSDAQDGWVVAMIATSANFSTGILFHTSDAGSTWQQLQMPVGGPVEFVNSTTGWLASSGQQGTNDKFYVTSDSGQTWTTQKVTPPDGFTQDQATYTIPKFTTPAPVIMAAFNSDTDSTAGLYQTDDNGANWQLKATIPAGNPQGDVSPSSTIISPSHWISITTNGSTLTDITQDGASKTSVTPNGLPQGAAIGSASFSDDGNGWVTINLNQCTGTKTDCTEIRALYGTTDNGENWTEITTPSSGTPSPTPTTQQ